MCVSGCVCVCVSGCVCVCVLVCVCGVVGAFVCDVVLMCVWMSHNEMLVIIFFKKLIVRFTSW